MPPMRDKMNPLEHPIYSPILLDPDGAWTSGAEGRTLGFQTMRSASWRMPSGPIWTQLWRLRTTLVRRW